MKLYKTENHFKAKIDFITFAIIVCSFSVAVFASSQITLGLFYITTKTNNLYISTPKASANKGIFEKCIEFLPLSM